MENRLFTMAIEKNIGGFEMKKRICVFLSTLLLVTLIPTLAFADTNNVKPAEDQVTVDQAKEVKKVELQKQLDDYYKTTGLKFEVLDGVDPSITPLEFDSVEEFKNAVQSVRFVPVQNAGSEPAQNSVNSLGSISPLSLSSFNNTFYNDGDVWVGPYRICTVRQAICATEEYNYANQRNQFVAVVWQNSYMLSTFGATDYAQDYATNSIIDGGRTLYGQTVGHCYLTANVHGLPVGGSVDAITSTGYWSAI